jgi:hypothetical protein
MRRDVQPHGEDAETGVYSFNFQISSSTGRQACSVKVQAQNFQDATQFIRQNWPIIETMAREELAKGCRHIESRRALMEIQHRSCGARKAAPRPLNEKRPPLRSRRRPLVRVGSEKKRPQRGWGAIRLGPFLERARNRAQLFEDTT